MRRRRPTCPMSSAHFRCWKSSLIGIEPAAFTIFARVPGHGPPPHYLELIGVHVEPQVAPTMASLHRCSLPRFSYTAAMKRPLLSPGAADALLFDLGRVV